MISKVRQHPKSNLGQLNAYKLMFAIKLSMKKRIKKCLAAWFSDLSAISATGKKAFHKMSLTTANADKPAETRYIAPG